MSFKGFPINGKINQPGYSAPEGYFDALPDKILKNIKLSEGEEVEVEGLVKSEIPFEVSDGYFNSLTDSILSKVKALDEETLSEPLQRAKSIQAFEAPDAEYFNSLPNHVLAEIKGMDGFEEGSAILKIGKELPFVTNADYFIDLPNVVLEKAKYAVGQASLKEDLVNEPAKILNFEPAQRKNRYFKFTLKHWSAAAAILIVAMVSFEFWPQLNIRSSLTNTASTEGIPQMAVQKASKELDGVSDANIQSYIQNNADEFDIQTIENAVAQNGNISSSDLLKSDDISDKDVEAYLAAGNY